MIKNNLWESLIWIIIWIFILSFIILWIANLLINSNNIVDTYDDKKIINILNNNTNFIINKLDLSNINENENFYLFKDKVNNKFLIFTWSSNIWYKYIDEYWNNIDDINLYNWEIFTRTIYIEKKDSSLWIENHVIVTNINKYTTN